MALALSHGGGDTIVATDQLSNRVHIGTMDRVVTIERSDKSWRIVGHPLKGLHVHALVHEPESKL